MKSTIWLSLVFLIVAACAPTPPKEKTAADYFQEAEVLFESRRYPEAIESYEKVREIFYSPEMNMLAELKIAEAHFLSKHYLEAAVAYEEFLKQHPTYPQMDQVLYQLGMSYYKQKLSMDRDQTATRNALVTFNTLLESYPDFPQAADIKAYRLECLDALVAHEIYVGDFYLRTDKIDAAIRRLQGVSELYPDHYYQRDRASFLLGKALLEADRTDEAREVFQSLIRQFPQSSHAKKAQKKLEDL